jgi:purine-binding chemotaxis protein CheW
MTLTTHEILVFETEGRLFGLPIGDVERVVPAVRPAPTPHAAAAFEGIVNLHGAAAMVLDLCAWFGDAPREMRLDDLLILLRAGTRPVALHVERARGVVTIAASAIRPAESVLASPRHFTGVVMIEGAVVFLPDVESFLRAIVELRMTEASAA